MDSSINLYDFALHSRNWGLTYRLILEFNGLRYHTNTVLESKKLKYQVACFNAQMLAQPLPRWNAHLELEFVELKY